MNNAPAILTIAAAGALLLAGRGQQGGPIEAGDGGGGFSLSAGGLLQAGEAAYYQLTESAGEVDNDQAGRNVSAFLAMLRQAEGTAGQPDPYRVTFGYGHVIADLSDHPAITGEWGGRILSDRMCSLAGFGPGCKSTAAGAYQIIKPTWRTLRDALGLGNFGPQAQDAAAVELLRRRGALPAIEAGDLARGVHIARHEWASLPGNTAGQGQRDLATLAAWFQQQGGNLA